MVLLQEINEEKNEKIEKGQKECNLQRGSVNACVLALISPAMTYVFMCHLMIGGYAFSIRIRQNYKIENKCNNLV